MKALGKHESAPGISLLDWPEPECGPNDVIIKVRKAAICGTDLHIHSWDEWARKTIPVPMPVAAAVLAGVRHSEVNFDSTDRYIVGTNGDDGGHKKTTVSP